MKKIMEFGGPLALRYVEREVTLYRNGMPETHTGQVLQQYVTVLKEDDEGRQYSECEWQDVPVHRMMDD